MISRNDSFRKKIILFLGYTFCLVVLPAIVNILVDPYRIYFEPFRENHLYSDHERFQNAGIINSNQIEYVILGTSMTSNFDKGFTEEIMGWRNFQRISLNGGRPEEILIVAKHLIAKQPNLKVLAMDIHWYYFEENKKLPKVNKSFPAYLYNDSILDDYKYIFNHDIFRKSTGIVFNRDREFVYANGRQNRWMDQADFAKYNSSRSLNFLKKRYQKNIDRWKIGEVVSKKLNTENLDRMISFVRENSSVEIILFFPPYSRFHYAVNLEPSIALMYLDARSYLVKNLKKYDHVKIYSFDHIDDIVSQFKNYKDYGHYSVNVNKKMLNFIKNGEGLITTDNIDVFRSQVIKKIKEFRM